jgi:flagellar biosynthetic protein FlhB
MENLKFYKIRLDIFGSEEKTEKATPRKRKKMREEGKTATSRDLPSAAAFLFVTFILLFWGGRIISGFEALIRYFLSIPNGAEFNQSLYMYYFQLVLNKSFYIVYPIFFTALGVGVAFYYLQVGFMFTTKSLMPDFKKINPLSGLKRMFSIRSLVELIKSLLKLVIVGYIAFSTLTGHIGELLNLSMMGIGQSLSDVSSIGFEIMVKTGMAIFAIAFLDYFYQKWQFEKDIRMSKQEVKDEMKDVEGRPEIKSAQRRMRLEIMKGRMMEEVKEAEVVITNPTHIAIALKYNSFKMNAPVVVAKGGGNLAKKIIEIANEYRIPVIENKPLAWKLFREVDLGDEIPVELYQTIADILAYVYKLKKPNKRATAEV